MTPLMTSISITDFRSLKGTVTVPLDAPVVLLHGPNGAGKTSVLSAIELSLTGEVAAMRRTDPNYQSHLVHRGAEFSRVVFSAAGVESEGDLPAEILVQSGEIGGRPFLEGDGSRFFGERCYLAQSTLGRLLEIYQNAKPREDSPLTRFVKDLLGLDQLDALLDGLHAVGDVRNIRRLVPDFANVENEKDAATARLATASRALNTVSSELSHIRLSIGATLAFLAGATTPSEPVLPVDVEIRLKADEEEKQLVALNGYRRDLVSLRQRVTAVAVAESAAEQAQAEREASEASAKLAAWWQAAGEKLETLISQLRESFPDLPSVASTEPALAYRTTLARVEAEISRCESTLAKDDGTIAKLGELAQSVEQNRARIAIVDEQIGLIAGKAESLSRALAALVPHIHDENCPVCGRDFSETSSQPLVQHVSAHVARLAEQADRLQSLGKTRLEASNDLTLAERARDAAQARRLSQEVRGQLKARAATLAESKTRLDGMVDIVSLGADTMRREAEARRRLSELRARDRLTIETRVAVNGLCTSLGQATLQEAEPTIDAIARLEVLVLSRHENLVERQGRRRQSLDQLQRVRRLEEEEAKLQLAIKKDAALTARQTAAIEAAEASRQSAKTVARAAAEARTAIVGRVFNSALNKVWRDLFVRLAPTEPYVPAFRLPRSASETVAAQLETVHREGGAGGAPGAMLSAGNLNTAALTLFLALHLSVKPQLPWLILDDPVQSMDEVHIAQFAALLRTLSKDLGRQIVIAVHDRPLFDYLSLELSPAFPGDRLITIELSRSLTGASLAEPTYHSWEPDRAIAA